MGWILASIIYVSVIAAMCYDSAHKTSPPLDKDIEDFIKKHTKRYED